MTIEQAVTLAALIASGVGVVCLLLSLEVKRDIRSLRQGHTEESGTWTWN